MWILNHFLYPSKVDNLKWLLGFHWVMHWNSSALLHLQFSHVWVSFSCAYPGSFFSVTNCICVLNHNVLNFHTLTQIVTSCFLFFFKHAQFRSEEAVLKVWTAALLKGQCSALGLLTAFVFRFCSPNCSSYSALLLHFHHDQWERQKARAARPQKGGLEMELKALTIFLQPAALSLALSFSSSTPSCSLKSVQSPLGQAQAGQWISSHLRGGANWKRAGRRTLEEQDPTINESGLGIKN